MEPVRKNSKKREEILRAIRSTETHPNAEWVYNKVREKFPKLSLGTVYRNMRLFVEEGEVICVGTVNGQERFDGFTTPHVHFICRSCGSVLDVPLEDTGFGEYEAVASSVGAEVETHSITFTGLCSNCKAN